jgi:hypothetical protein
MEMKLRREMGGVKGEERGFIEGGGCSNYFLLANIFGNANGYARRRRWR